MLKPLNQPRLSPASPSPRINHQSRYAAASPRTITTPVSRKKSIVISSPSLIPIPAPPRREVVQYVTRGTQYSPRIQKMDTKGPDSASSTQPSTRTAPARPIAVLPTAPPSSISSSPSKPALKPESPGVKRRQPVDETQSTTSHEVAPKRTRSAPSAVKILPLKYEECAVEDLVILIANMIAELIETNDALPPRPNPVLTRFHSRTPPGISVLDYLQRLAKHATLTPPLLLSMVYYIDRLCALYPDFTVTTLTIHRFLITAATVAAKGLSDSFWNNSTYARVGGIKIAELGLLELDFLYRVDWKIVPNPEVLVDYYKGLIERTDGFTLEGDSSSSELDEDDEDEDEESTSAESPTGEAEAGSERAAQWQAWMDSNKKAETGEVAVQGAEAASTQNIKKEELSTPSIKREPSTRSIKKESF